MTDRHLRVLRDIVRHRVAMVDKHTPRVGRVVVGRGRDAVDVALITSFGPLTLTTFQVHAQEPAPAAAG